MNAPSTPSSTPPDPVRALARRLHLEVGDAALYLEALTHASYAAERGGEHWERLEFVGDAALRLAVTEWLYAHPTRPTEGEMSRIRSVLVSNRALATLARSWGLPDLLRLGRGEQRTGGRHKARLLAEALEAVLGAAYLDAGLPMCRRLLDSWLQNRGEQLVAGDPRDPKTILQETVHADGLPVPEYHRVGQGGPAHRPEFEVTVSLAGEFFGRGCGGKWQEAEREAAREALQRYRARASASPDARADPPPAGGSQVTEDER